MPIEFFQITAAYSNALLVAVMPHVSDFAKKLDLPTPQPVTISQVKQFVCFPRTDHIGGRVVLTNGCEFIFDHGRVERFDSPRSFYYLQDPDLVPTFYGEIKISQERALQIAHDAIKKLGYNDAMLSADKPPRLKPPIKDHNHFIARYDIRWDDPTRGDNPNDPPKSIEFEIDATTGQIQTIDIQNPNTYRANPELSVKPAVVEEKATVTPIGAGRKIYPVSESYSNAFLAAILPQCSQYARTAGFQIKSPIALTDVDKSSYECGLVDNDPMASFTLKTGERFDYRHGQVIAFYAADVMTLPGRKNPVSDSDISRERAKFFGSVNMTAGEAVSLVRQTVKKLGYSEKTLHISEPPRIGGPGWWGTNRIARCFIVWSGKEGLPTYVNAEVDVDKKILKSLYINDHVITNIWRKPPKIDAEP
jgi:hypothetical protein